MWLRAVRTARPMRTAFGSPRWPPDFDEGRLLDRLIFGRISLRVVRRLRDGLGHVRSSESRLGFCSLRRRAIRGFLHQRGKKFRLGQQ